MHDFTYPGNRFFVRIWELYFKLLQTVGGRFYPQWREAYQGLPGLLRETRWVADLSNGPGNGRDVLPAQVAHFFDGGGKEDLSDENRAASPLQRPGRRPIPASGILVHEIILNQRGAWISSMATARGT